MFRQTDFGRGRFESILVAEVNHDCEMSNLVAENRFLREKLGIGDPDQVRHLTSSATLRAFSWAVRQCDVSEHG